MHRTYQRHKTYKNSQQQKKIWQTKTTRFVQILASTRDFKQAKAVDRQLQSNFFSEPDIKKNSNDGNNRREK